MLSPKQLPSASNFKIAALYYFASSHNEVDKTAGMLLAVIIFERLLQLTVSQESFTMKLHLDCSY